MTKFKSTYNEHAVIFKPAAVFNIKQANQ